MDDCCRSGLIENDRREVSEANITGDILCRERIACEGHWLRTLPWFIHCSPHAATRRLARSRTLLEAVWF